MSNSWGDFFALMMVGLFVAMVAVAFTTLPIMWIWNWIVPDLTGFKAIGFWDAFFLSFMVRLMTTPVKATVESRK